MPRALRLSVWFALLVFVAVGCDTAPGLPDASDPPIITAFSFTPLQFNFDGDGETAQIPLALNATVAGTASEVRYTVRRQSGTETVAEGTLSGQGGTFSASETLALPRGETGLYVVTVIAAGPDGAVGNQATGLFRFSAGNLGPPVITEIDGPGEFQPPGTLVLVAVVTDPDGLGNIARVEGTTPTGVLFQLFDDGASSGDETAGDGRYTASFDVPSATPGDQTFTFIATDNFGAQSDEVSFTVTILP